MTEFLQKAVAACAAADTSTLLYVITQGAMLLLVLYFFWRVHSSKDTVLNFADILTSDGKKVSLSKVLQLTGGITSTLVIWKLTLAGSLSEGIFAIYLTYVASVEGFSRYMAATKGYKEGSIIDAKNGDDQPTLPMAYKPEEK